MKKLKVLFLVFLALVMLTPECLASIRMIKGRDAERHIGGDIKKHIFAGNYTYENLKRSHRDNLNGRFSDAIIFNTNGKFFEYPRRKDGDHIVVLNSPGGREESAVSQLNWLSDLKNALNDDVRKPHVFLDEKGNEQAIVFIGKGQRLLHKPRGDEQLRFMIHDVGKNSGSRSLRRRRRNQ